LTFEVKISIIGALFGYVAQLVRAQHS
jgi:hypothetical protein